MAIQVTTRHERPAKVFVLSLCRALVINKNRSSLLCVLRVLARNEQNKGAPGYLPRRNARYNYPGNGGGWQPDQEQQQ
jgi:hypothetical protein